MVKTNEWSRIVMILWLRDFEVRKSCLKVLEECSYFRGVNRDVDLRELLCSYLKLILYLDLILYMIWLKGIIFEFNCKSEGMIVNGENFVCENVWKILVFCSVIKFVNLLNKLIIIWNFCLILSVEIVFL